MKLKVNKNIIVILVSLVVVTILISSYLRSPEVICRKVIIDTFNSNESKIKLTTNDRNKITEFYNSASEYNLPYPKLELSKSIKLENGIFQTTFIQKFPKSNHNDYYISFDFDYKIFKDGNILEEKYKGIIDFQLNRVGFNKWVIEKVMISKITPYIDGKWSSNFE